MVIDTENPGFLRRVLQHTWIDIVSQVRGEDASPLSHGEAQLWTLILASRHVPYRLHQWPKAEGGGYAVQVQQWFLARAVDEITLYYEENQPDWRGVNLVDLRPVSGVEPTLLGLSLLIVFFWVYNRTFPGWGLYPERWLKLGSADAWAILSGEWWRLATALTLHADGPHVVGNAVIGGVFIWLTSRRIGSGLAWFLTLLAGMIGNLFNSMALGVHHNSIGFSTATFGAAGVLAAISPFGVGGGLHGRGHGSVLRRFLGFVRSALVPFGAGLGLLAMLGAGEETDLSAHAFGFVAGLGLGCTVGFLTTRFGLPGKSLGAWLYLAALAMPVLAWVWGWVV
ncbi:rhomboid family intramembrane serine protease [Pseudodesulfovibrio sp. S3]|nr:rhomboid family intramembrane serine protease [Pseudodesulfovibrio sp. S3]